MRSLLLLRHGESTWNAQGRWQGWADPPLSARGEAQAAEAAERLGGEGLDAVVASDLARARDTACIVADALGLEVVVVDPGLRELDVGEWCGLTRAEIGERWPAELAAWDEGRLSAVPGGESRAALSARVLDTLNRLASAPGRGERLLVVTHGGALRVVDRALGFEPVRRGNLGGRWVQVSADGALRPGEEVVLVDPPRPPLLVARPPDAGGE